MPDPGSVLLLASWLVQLFFTGLNVPMLILSAALLSVALLAAYVIKPSVRFLHWRELLPWMMLMIVVWVFFSAHLSLAPYRSWLYGWIWLALPITFFIVVQLREVNDRHLKMFITAAGALLSLVSIYQFHFQVDMYGYRAPGTLLDANSYACLINLLLLPSVAWLVCDKYDGKPSLIWLALFLMVGGICSTGSRAGILVMFAGLLMLMVVAWRTECRLRPIVAVLVLAAGWVAESLMFTDGALAQRVHLANALHDPSVSARFLIWDACLKLIQSAPWWGTGLGTFPLLYPKVRSVQEAETSGG